MQVGDLEAQKESTTVLKVGPCGSSSHAFPTEDGSTVNLRIKGFEQDPATIHSQTFVTRARMPQLEGSLPGSLSRLLPTTIWEDAWRRLDVHCGGFVTDGKAAMRQIPGIIVVVTCVVAISIWNAAAASGCSKEGCEEDDGGPSWQIQVFVPVGLCVLYVALLFPYIFWATCTQNPKMDLAMAEECKNLSEQHRGISFTFTSVSVHPNQNKPPHLKYVTIRVTGVEK